MEHHAQHAGAVHMATRLVQEVVGCDNRQRLLELLLGDFHIVVAASSHPTMESKSPRWQNEATTSSLSCQSET